MRTIRYILGMLLAMTCGMQAYAQAIEDGEAFYIYRNDGDFNGFFYDEVLDMRYSKYDLDMVEFDNYVVQEIVTADSVYRIPLCVIDSISFVQPPIEFNPNLRYMTKDVYGNYCAGYDKYENMVYFYKGIPDDLLPKVGDVIIGFCDELMPDLNNNDNFGIKVTSCSYNSGLNLWEVSGTEIDKLSDVFTKFVSTERLIFTPEGKSVRRMAGLKTLATRSEASGSLNLINLQGTLTREFEERYNGTLAITLDYGIRAGISVTYDIDIDHIFVRMATEQELSAQAGVSGSFSATWEPPIDIVPSWLTSIKFPACLPIFETQPVPSLFFKAEGKIALKSTLPQVRFKSKQLVIISDRTGNWLNCKCTSSLTAGSEEDEEKLVQAGDSRLSFEGSIYSGVKFETRIKTNSWAAKLFQSSIGFDVCIGPKLSGHIDLSLPDLAKGNVAYKTLKSAYVSFDKCSIDMEASAKVKLYGYPDQETKFGDMSIGLGSSQRYLVTDVQYEKPTVVNHQDNTITANLKWKNEVLSGQIVGFAVFKKHNLANGRHDDDECVYDGWGFHFREENGKEFVTPKLDAGYYWYSPYVTFLGNKIYIDPQEDSFGPSIKLDVDSLSFAATAKNGFARTVIHYECDEDVEIRVYFENVRGENVSIDYEAKTITFDILDNKQFFNLLGKVSITAIRKFPGSTYTTATGIAVPIRQAANTNIKEICILNIIKDGKLKWTYSHYATRNGEVISDERSEGTRELNSLIRNCYSIYDGFIPCTTSFSNNQLTITAKTKTEKESVEVRAVFNIFDNYVELESFSSDFISEDFDNYSSSFTRRITEKIEAVNVDSHRLRTSNNDDGCLVMQMEKANCSVTRRIVEDGTVETVWEGTTYFKDVQEENGLLDDPDNPITYGDFKYKY